MGNYMLLSPEFGVHVMSKLKIIDGPEQGKISCRLRT